MTQNAGDLVVLVGDMYAPEAEEFLRRNVDCVKVVGAASLSRPLAERVTAMIVRYPQPVDRAVIGRCKRLRLVVTSGSGTDNVDRMAAIAAGVTVLRTHGVNAASVAEHTLALLLSLSRGLRTALSASPERFWHCPPDIDRFELAGKVLGLVGCGAVGSEVGRRAARGLDMRVLAHDPRVPLPTPSWLDEVVGLSELLAAADVVSVHVPLDASTRGLVDESFLRTMKRTSILVNTSRGAVVVEEALVRALRERWIAGAALDVFASEPLPVSSELWGTPRLVMTPHVADATDECRRIMAMTAARRCLVGLGIMEDAVA